MERADELRRLAATPGLPEALVAHLTEQARLATSAPALTEMAPRHLARRKATGMEAAD